MKKNFRKIRLLLVCVLLCFACAAAVFAEEAELWNQKVYHITDVCDVIPAEDHKAENAENNQNIVAAEFDFAVMISGKDSIKDHEYTDYLDNIYKINDLGYGENRDGIMMGIDPDSQRVAIRLFGCGADIFSRSDIDELIENIQKGYQEDSYLGAVRAYRLTAFEKVQGYRANPVPVAEKVPFVMLPVSLENFERATAPIINDVQMPTWYASDPDAFVDFHNDESVPRLIDNADILSDKEEAAITARLAQLRASCNQDIVIMTDNTSYGLDNELYEMDFYVYNGYGIGDEFDGLMLFINMDPDNREMVSTAFGKTRTPFTQSNSNQLDDILYYHLVAQEYEGAFMDWMDGVENLLTFGHVHFPSWYADYVKGTLPESASQEKLVNELGRISEKDLQDLQQQIDDLRTRYNTDVVVYITNIAYNLTDESDNKLTDAMRVDSYLDTFYQAHGYGVGENKSGILLGIMSGESSSYATRVRTYGDMEGKISEKGIKRLSSAALLNLSDGNYHSNVNRYLRFLKPALKNGYVPHNWLTRIFWAVLCTACGAFVGSKALSMEKRREGLITVKVSDRADDLLVPGSLQLLASDDVFLHTTTERIRRPKETSSSSGSYRSSGSSGHTSHYSSSSHSSSGRSGSTSRRSF